MALYERLTGVQFPRIPVHAFMGALGERERGLLTDQQVIDAFSLDAGEQVEALALIAKIIPPRESLPLGARMTLTNIGTAFVNLAFARIESAGINAFEFTVAVNKIGAGTQHWQLWDLTNGAELAILSDAGGTGEKILGPTVATFSPLAPGLRSLSVRGRSTTGTDDPIFIGASLLIQRIGLMTADVLHQILLLAELGLPPYHTVAALKARLGVS